MTGRADIVIVGGGPVGAALAVQVAAARFNVVVIDPRTAGASSRDVRPIALSHGSRLILERLGVWEGAPFADATRIGRIHVSQRGAFGRAMLTAAEACVPALGYVTDYAGIVAAFDKAVSATTAQPIRGARVTLVESEGNAARVRYETPAGTHELVAALAVIADGGESQAFGAVEVREYGQSAVTARVATSEPHRNTAYERFTPDGPVALLPFGQEYALVWTTATAEAEVLADAAPHYFLEQLQARFGERAGRFTSVSARAAHRLSLRVARDAAVARVVTIGNAAQALHPVAGQGFNLGLRDAWELASELRARGFDDKLVDSYRARRRWDRAGGVAFTDTLVTLFSNDSRALALARAAGLVLIDNVPPVKDFFVRRMMFGARG